jgi:hypothetical protein
MQLKELPCVAEAEGGEIVKIRVELEVPNDDCRGCELRVHNYYSVPKCLLFDFAELERNERDGSLKRCQACIDATFTAQTE